VAYGARNGQPSMGHVATLSKINKSQALPATASVGIVLRIIKIIAMLIGTITWGGRLAPVTGMPCISSIQML